MRRATFLEAIIRGAASLSRTLNLQNALFLHREKSAGRRLDSVIIIRFRRGQSNYFTRTRVARCFTSLLLSPFLFLSFFQFATLIVSSVGGSMPERSISRPAFLPVRDIPTNGFLRGIPRKSLTGTFPSYREKKTPELYLSLARSPFHRLFLCGENYRLSHHVLLTERKIAITHKRLFPRAHIKQLLFGFRVSFDRPIEGPSYFEAPLYYMK